MPCSLSLGISSSKMLSQMTYLMSSRSTVKTSVARAGIFGTLPFFYTDQQELIDSCANQEARPVSISLETQHVIECQLTRRVFRQGA